MKPDTLIYPPLYADMYSNMRALTVLYGGSLVSEAFEPVLGGKSAFNLALERAAAFPGSEKIVLLSTEGCGIPGGIPGEIPPAAPPGVPVGTPPTSVSVVQRPVWTVSELLKVLSEESSGYDFAYYAWADTPFLDPALAGRIAERHTRFAAEYSYADGWPYGLGPELINSAAAGILYKIAGDAGEGPVKRDSLFAVLQKDINSFDIETEISPVDLRYHRLSLSADSRRNLLLLERFASAGCSGAEDSSSAPGVGQVIQIHPEYLRTLPAFFPIQVSASCPARGGACELCPYPRFAPQNSAAGSGGEKTFLDVADFSRLLEKIEAFSGDAVIDISLWGEIALHPQRETLIEAVLERPALSLVLETSGCGWADFRLEAIAEKAKAAPKRHNGLPALSWIVSLAPADLPVSDTEAVSFVRKLLALFPREAGKEDLVYVETVRTAGAEDAVEQFYRAWKAGFHAPAAANAALATLAPPAIIIQKYDYFCGFLPQRQAVDLSPVERRPCWHLMRDFPVLIDGTVPLCREDLSNSFEKIGNVFREDPEAIWKRGEEFYLSHCRKDYAETCKRCDEYYTFNF